MQRILLLLLCLWSLSAAAQPLRVELDYRPAKDEHIEVFPSSLGLTLLFYNGYNLRCFVLNDQLQLLRRSEATLGQAYIGRTRLGTLDLADRLILLFEEGSSYHAVTLHKYSGQIEEYPLLCETQGKDTWLTTLSAAGELLILKLMKKEETLRLCRYAGGEELQCEQQVLPSPDWAEWLKSYRGGRLPVGGEEEAFAALRGDTLCLVSGSKALLWQAETLVQKSLQPEALQQLRATPNSGNSPEGLRFQWQGQTFLAGYEAGSKAYVIHN